ncbi:MAG: T9SS type A sorting domain-containing protein [Chitinophagales bacterium]|nr:T9SS type A sorting domain-containing protein [Chitinophagales bacterium]
MLFAPSTEGVAITYQCNMKYFWIVAHEFGNNNFRIYSVDSNGINIIPQIITIGSTYPSHFSMFKFSSNGNKLASAFGSTQPINDLFDFDTEKGIISNYIQLIGFGGDYSPEFSFNNTKLYYVTSGNIIYQYDLISDIDSVINNSRIIVSNVEDNSTYGFLSKVPDGKIYIAGVFRDSISTIESPDAYGLACSVNTFSFYLKRESELGLPNFISNYFNKGVLESNCAVGISQLNSDKVELFPNPAHEIISVKSKTIRSITLIDILENIFYNNDCVTSSSTLINIASFHRGVYFMRIKTEKNIILKQIILN